MRSGANKNIAGDIVSVESYSHNLALVGRVEITKAEFEAFLAALPVPAAPIDWRAEWQKATTTASKISVLAKIQGLE